MRTRCRDDFLCRSQTFLLQILLGCFAGLTPPSAVSHSRSILACHLELIFNGMLSALVGLLVPHMVLGRGGQLLLEVSANMGTWAQGFAFAHLAITGNGTPLGPLMNASHPPKSISTSSFSHIMLMLCAPSIIIALITAVICLLRGSAKDQPKHA
ncbi:hypothetical protein ABBQ38_006399 [Trebouxia sp. C0009 RCD-2024]